MRDCLFLVADKNMEGVLKGFLSKPDFHLALGCASFVFDPKQDLVVAHGQNDPGLYTRANALLQPFVHTHKHAVVIVDAAWEGSPGYEAILQRVREHIINAGWDDGAGCAVVIVPELENWVWQDSPQVCTHLGYSGCFQQLRTELESLGFWNTGEPKPHQPKEAVEQTLKQARKPRSSAIYQSLAAQVSLKRCTDSALNSLLESVRRWFPRDIK